MWQLDEAIRQTREFGKLAYLIKDVKTQNTPGNIVNYTCGDYAIEVAVRISKTVMKTLDNSTDILDSAKEVLAEQCEGVDTDNLKCHLHHISRSTGTVIVKVTSPLQEKK